MHDSEDERDDEHDKQQVAQAILESK